VLAEKKIDCDLVIDSPWVEGNQVAAVNPLGKIPVLVLDDESTLYDSRVIAEYLDTVAPNNRLIPASGRERISVKRWEALADGVLDAAVAAFLEAKRPDGERSASWIERQRGKVNQALKVMADDLGEQPWCHGNSFSLADIAVGCALGYVSLRLGDIRWREQYPNLAQLYEKLMQRAAFAETVPQG
jgi:glutathione S-transferase